MRGSQCDSDGASTIVLFDGLCNLCNSSVDFIIRHERNTALKFASLQSECAKQMLTQHGIEIVGDPDSIVVVAGGKLLQESDAALAIASYLSMPWRLVTIGKIVPRFVRDRIYKWIARNRYKWFGKKETCRIPTPEERSRFLGMVLLLVPLTGISCVAQSLNIGEQYRKEVEESSLHQHYKQQLLDSAQLHASIERVHMIATGSSSGWHDDSENHVMSIEESMHSPFDEEDDKGVHITGFHCHNDGVGGFISVEGWFSDAWGRSSAMLYFYKGVARNGFRSDLGYSRGKAGGGMQLESAVSGNIVIRSFAWSVELNEEGDSWDPVPGADNYNDTILGHFADGQIWFPWEPSEHSEYTEPHKRIILLDFNRDGALDTLLMSSTISYSTWLTKILIADTQDTVHVPHLIYSSTEYDSLNHYGEQFPVIRQEANRITFKYVTERNQKETMTYAFVWNDRLKSWIFDKTSGNLPVHGKNVRYTRIEEFDATWTYDPY